jgi:hypothetical protein
MAKIFLSRVWVRIDGTLMETDPTTTKLDFGGYTREAVVTDQGFVGYTERPKEGSIETTIRVASDTDLEALRNATNIVVTAQYNTGQVFVMRDATIAEPPAVTSDGKCTIRLFGHPVEQS